MRESIDSKAKRYLVEARVLVEHVDAVTVLARVRGSDGYYNVRGDDTGWSCTCPSTRRCCHETAVMLVTLRPRKRP